MCHRALRKPNTTLSPGKRSPAAPGPLGAELTLKRAPDSPSLIGAELSLGTKRQLSSSLQEGAHRTQSRKHLSELPLEASLLPQELTVQSPRHSCTSTFRLSPLLLVMDSSLIQVPQVSSRYPRPLASSTAPGQRGLKNRLTATGHLKCPPVILLGKHRDRTARTTQQTPQTPPPRLKHP